MHINHDNKFDMSKLVVGIQLFPNKIDDSKLYTYEEVSVLTLSFFNIKQIVQVKYYFHIQVYK